MLKEASRNRVRRLLWRANKRTLPAADHVPDVVLKQVDEFRETGAFDQAVKLLERQPSDALSCDARALSRLAVCRYGNNDHEGALVALDNAEAALRRATALLDLTRANIFKANRRFDEALVVARRVREFAPHWCAGHLMVIAIHECRGTPEDRTAVEEAVALMQRVWPEWRQDGELKEYLLTDVDYAEFRQRFRNRPEFSPLFDPTLPLPQGEA